MDQNEILMLSLIGSLSGIVILMLKLCFQSKCSTIDLCCGLMKIKREVQLEKDLDEKPEQQKTNSPLSMPKQQPQTDLTDLNV